MAITPKLYAEIGEALFGQHWVYEMRALLDIRKPVAEQIAFHAAHGLPFDMPPGIEPKLQAAIDAKIRQLADVLLALETAGDR